MTFGDPPDEVAFETAIEVGRPVGLLEASPLDVPIAVNFGPMELPPAEVYAWSVSVDGTEVERLVFQTRSEDWIAQ